MEALEKARFIAQALDEKKAMDILIIHVADKTVVCDYFVIASGPSSTHVATLAEEVMEKTAKAGEPYSRAEGVREGRWVVLDYGDVLVHIFHNEEREFYGLERLWADDENCEKYPAPQ